MKELAMNMLKLWPNSTTNNIVSVWLFWVCVAGNEKAAFDNRTGAQRGTQTCNPGIKSAMLYLDLVGRLVPIVDRRFCLT